MTLEEDLLEGIYREHVRRVISVAFENYLGGERQDVVARALHAGLAKTEECRAMLQKEFKVEDE